MHLIFLLFRLTDLPERERERGGKEKENEKNRARRPVVQWHSDWPADGASSSLVIMSNKR